MAFVERIAGQIPEKAEKFVAQLIGKGQLVETPVAAGFLHIELPKNHVGHSVAKAEGVTVVLVIQPELAEGFAVPGLKIGGETAVEQDSWFNHLPLHMRIASTGNKLRRPAFG